MLNIFGLFKNTPQQISANYTERVVANGGSLTTTQQNAILALVTNLQKYGLWNKMKFIYPFPTNSAAACAVNLVSSNYLATFSSGWTFSAQGGKPTGANTYMIPTGFNPYLLLEPYNTSFSYYSRTNNTRRGFELGIVSSLSPEILVSQSMYDALTPPAAAFCDLNNFGTAGGGGRIQVPTTGIQTLGLYMGTRTSTTSHKYFRNGVLFGSENTATMTTQLPNAILNIGTLSFNDGINYISTDRQCAFAHAGTGMNNDEALNFYNSVQAFQTALSRAV